MSGEVKFDTKQIKSNIEMFKKIITAMKEEFDKLKKSKTNTNECTRQLAELQEQIEARRLIVAAVALEVVTKVVALAIVE